MAFSRLSSTLLTSMCKFQDGHTRLWVLNTRPDFCDIHQIRSNTESLELYFCGACNKQFEASDFEETMFLSGFFLEMDPHFMRHNLSGPGHLTGVALCQHCTYLVEVKRKYEFTKGGWQYFLRLREHYLFAPVFKFYTTFRTRKTPPQEQKRKRAYLVQVTLNMAGKPMNDEQIVESFN